MPKQKSDGGWILPEIIDPARRCICIPVPDEPAHRQAFYGALLMLGYQHNWQRDPEHKALPVSNLWMEIVTEAITRFNSGTDYMCFSCEELAACLEPLLNDQTQAIINNITNLQKYGTQTPGVPMTPGQILENLAGDTNPTCDLDILWAQCLAIVQFTNRMITDTLEKVEIAGNVVELAELIGEIPILGWAAELSGGSLVVEAINYFQEAIAESYTGQYTEEVEVALACQLFCICKADCEINIDRLYNMTAGNLGSLIPSDIGDLVDLIEIVAGIDFDGSEVVDICFFFAWGTAKLAQFIFGDNLASGSLQLLLGLAVDDASADWELLCETCPEELCVFYDFTASAFEFIPGNGFGSSTVYDAGDGWEMITEPGQFIDVRRDVTPDMPAPARVRMHFLPVASGGGCTLYLSLDGVTVYSSIFNAVTAGDEEFTFELSYTGDFDRIDFQLTFSAPQSGQAITGLTVFTQVTEEIPAWLDDAAPC